MSSSDGGADTQAKMSEKEATYEELPDLLAQPKEILLQIVNSLDAKSFLKLASTCKYLLNFCKNSKGIHVVFKVPDVTVENDRNGNICYNYWFECHWVFSAEIETGRKYVDQLRKWPFHICIGVVRFRNLEPNFTWDRVGEEIKAHFLTIGVKKILDFRPPVPALETVRDVEYLVKFIKTFEIGYVNLHQVVPEGVFEACLKITVLHLFISRGRRDSNFNVDSVLQCSIPTLCYAVNMNLLNFEKIFEMWMTRNGLKSWKFLYDPNSFNIMNYFDDWEILSFTSAGPIDPKRPLVFMDVRNVDYEEEKKFFYLLRNDGKVLRIDLHTVIRFMEFNICPSNETPSALRAFLV